MTGADFGAAGLLIACTAGLLVLDVVLDRLTRWRERERERDRIAIRRQIRRYSEDGRQS